MNGSTTGVARLDCLVGTWSWNGHSNAEPFDVSGQTAFEWLPGGHFLIERGELTAQGVTNSSIAIIGYDEQSRACRAHYFDSDGVADTYTIDIHDGTVVIEWAKYRFRGVLSDDGNTITGTWEQAPDGERWTYWYDLELRRIT